MLKMCTRNALHPARLVVLLYLLIAFVLTITILAVGNSALVGSQYDGALGLWSVWWPAHAFASNQNLAYTDYVLYPIATNVFPLLSIPLTLIYTPLSAFLQPFLSYHLLLLICLWLNATAGYSFLKRNTDDHIDWFAFTGGFIIAFNPLTWIIASRGEFALLTIFPLLWSLICWNKLIERPTFRAICLLAAALYLTLLTSIQFWNLLLTFWLPYAFWTSTRSKQVLFDWLLLGGLMLLGAVAFYPLSSLLWSTYVPLYPPIEVWQGTTQLNILIWIALLGLAILLRRLTLAVPEIPGSARQLWILLMLLHVILYAAPQFAPLSLLQIPGLPDLTKSAVFLFPIILSFLAVAVDFAQRRWASSWRLTRGQAIAACVTLTVLSGWFIPLPRTLLPDTGLYATLAHDAENYTVIDFPIGVDSHAGRVDRLSGGDRYPTFGIPYRAGLTLAYMPWHGKRVMGGVVNTLHPADLAVYHDSDLARIMAMTAPPGDLSTAARNIREQLASWRVGYIIIHPEDGDPVYLRQWLVWLGTFCLVDQHGSTELWRSRWHPAGCPEYQLDIGAPDDSLAVGEGWYSPEMWPDQSIRWARSEQVSILTLWLQPSSDYTLHIQAAAPDIDGQQVEVWANGQYIGQFNPEQSWQAYPLELSREIIESGGALRIELRHAVSVLRDGRTLSAAYDYVRVSPVGDK